MNNVTQHDGMSNLSQEFDSPDCRPQMVPGKGDDPMAMIDGQTTELLSQIAARDAQIAGLLAMFEKDQKRLTLSSKALDGANSIIHELRYDLRRANDRIVELELALR